MNDNIRKVFDMLGVEPNEKFKIEIVGVEEALYYIDKYLIVWFETQEKRDRSNYNLCNFLRGDIKIIKLPKKKKLRDLTDEEYDKWQDKNCGVSTSRKCNGCPFENVICNSGNGCCWINHKDLFSDKFLDQEIEVEE